MVRQLARRLVREVYGTREEDTAAGPWLKASEMLHLDFGCSVGVGVGQYSELVFPSREEFEGLPEGWKDRMEPGSLNANVMGFPFDFSELVDGEGYGLTRLDNSSFKPVAIIPGHLIENNLLVPTDINPNRGDAQIWPCEVSRVGTSDTFNAWAVRRVGSGYNDVIELMSANHLRSQHDLNTHDQIKLRLFAPKA